MRTVTSLPRGVQVEPRRVLWWDVRMNRPVTIPLGATSVRPAWAALPQDVRRMIEQRCGAAVVEATSQARGFTPGFASRLLLADGERVFVKAADDETRGPFAAAYRKEASVVPALPADVPAPALRWVHDAGGWVVLCFDDVAGSHPVRPWQPVQLTAVLHTLGRVAEAMTPVPPRLVAPPFAAEFGHLAGMWDALSDLPHAEEAAELAALGVAVCAGDSALHTDVRDDNVIIDPAGRVWLCDWNWVCAGVTWFDTLSVLVSAYGDGLDADAELATNPLTASLADTDIDAVLALLAGYFITVSSHEVPPSSPHLRAHQRWYAEVTWQWLSRRRRWSGEQLFDDLRGSSPGW